jgi:hypothetical protein
MMTKEAKAMGYNISKSSNLMLDPTPTYIMGKMSMLKVSLDKGETSSDGVMGLERGKRVDKPPVTPIRNVLPTDDAAAAIIDPIGEDVMKCNCKNGKEVKMGARMCGFRRKNEKEKMNDHCLQYFT